mmetsp:Transcript_25072/g.34798  ORF Transcript_25072/g.34798 Transcript_25072/m.34798 type:complete len:732 (+) Transcript_25072:20-2215(+)
MANEMDPNAIGTMIQGATDGFDLGAMQEENNKEMKALEGILGGGKDDDENDPELLKELHAMGYKEDGEDDEEAELMALWENEHGKPNNGDNKTSSGDAGNKVKTESRVETNTETPALNPATTSSSTTAAKQSTDPPAAKRVKTKEEEERRRVLQQVNERYQLYKQICLAAKKKKDLNAASFYLKHVKAISAIRTKIGNTAERVDSSILSQLPPNPPPAPPVAVPKKMAKSIAKTVRKKKAAESRATSSSSSSSSSSARRTQQRKQRRQQHRNPPPALQRQNSAETMTAVTQGAYLEKRTGTDNAKLSVKQNLDYATMIEKCQRQAEQLRNEAKNCLARKDREMARKLVQMRNQSLKDRDLLITAQQRGAAPCTYEYKTFNVGKLNYHPELKPDDLAITVVNLHTTANTAKTEGHSLFLKYEINIPKPGETGAQKRTTSTVTVKEGATSVNDKAIFAFKRSSRSTVRKFERMKVTIKAFETSRMRLFFGDQEVGKGEVKLADLKTRSDVTIRIPIRKNRTSAPILEVEVTAELRAPLIGQDIRPFAVDYLKLNDDFGAFPSNDAPPPPTTTAPQRPANAAIEVGARDLRGVEEKGGAADENASMAAAAAAKSNDSQTDVQPTSQVVTAVPVKPSKPAPKPKKQPKKQRPLPPGIKMSDVTNPNDITRFKSFDALEAEIKALTAKLGRAPTAQLKSRKDLAEHIRDVMIAAVQQEQMSMEDYLDLLRVPSANL